LRLGSSTRIFVAGHRGMVGSALVRALRARGHEALLLRTRAELDLTDQRDVRRFFEHHRPEVVLLAAARVGGIHANSSRPAEFLRDNLLIQDNVIDAAHKSGVNKLVFLGSSCIYPKLASQPIREESLLTGPLEATNEWYAIAKIAGIKLCQALRRQFGFNAISLMPTNLYGPEDNFDLEASHVVPALIRKIHEAKLRKERTVTIWGTGTPRREFLHVDDLADAVLYLLHGYDGEQIVNVGWGQDVTIQELATTLMSVIDYKGQMVFDTSKPDGTPRKVLDVSRLTTLGWSPRIGLRRGLEETYAWFLEHQHDARMNVRQSASPSIR
jgi:GDP-L-fucose synthase